MVLRDDIPKMDGGPVSEAVRDAFLHEIYRQRCDLTAAEADRMIAERQMNLLEAAPPPEGRVIRTRFGPEADTIRSEKNKP